MSHQEIAEKFNISEEAVNKQIKRARKQLRVTLGLLTYMVFCYKFATAVH